MELSKNVAGKLAENHPKIREGVEKAMGGQILDYEAKRIKREGKQEGIREGKQEGIREGKQEGAKDMLNKVAERMIRAGRPGEEIVSFTDLGRDAIDSIGKKMKINVVWNGLEH